MSHTVQFITLSVVTVALGVAAVGAAVWLGITVRRHR